MQIYKAPIEDMMFQLAAFGYDRVSSLDEFSAYDLETVRMVLDQTGSLVVDVLLPCNRTGDQQGAQWVPETGAVKVPDGYLQAHQACAKNGYYGLTASPDYEGGGAPVSLGTLVKEMLMSGNKSFSMCQGLSHGLIEALEAHATEELKQAYLPKLTTGQWSGTMCLTEPQCGTDLGLLTTRAEPFEDRYRITGTKIWITFGEHDLTENICHLVLARLPDAPSGIKGISTFLVPKIRPDGSHNGVRCTGLEHKMGINGSPTCVMDLDGAEGYLVGSPNRGMESMFTMMNAARLFVGVEGISLSEIAYQTALAFAKDRRQGRSLNPSRQEAGADADNILVHPDVRRMLVGIKANIEALRGLATWISTQIDISHAHPDAEVRQRADDLVALLTPVMKAHGTERGFRSVSDAMQVCGGAGYTADWSIEQYLRDLRIALIYEGTNHIQALDLVGRKLPRHGGRLFKTFSEDVTALIAKAGENPETQPLSVALDGALKTLTKLTLELGARSASDPEEIGASASQYLEAFGLVASTYSLTRQAHYATVAKAPNRATKLKTARFYAAKVLPELDGLVQILGEGKSPIMDFDPDEL